MFVRTTFLQFLLINHKIYSLTGGGKKKTWEDLKHTSVPQTQQDSLESLDPPNPINIKRLAWASGEIQKERKVMDLVTITKINKV